MLGIGTLAPRGPKLAYLLHFLCGSDALSPILLAIAKMFLHIEHESLAVEDGLRLQFAGFLPSRARCGHAHLFRLRPSCSG